jgi:DNA helicase-2/ATP-dependent DNA helicase PcrA
MKFSSTKADFEMSSAEDYRAAYRGLNQQQKQAVDQVDGPVLVIAGPGTGKTQLLTTRIAHILATTDTLAQNILCLTFTDSAAQTMQTRLAGLIGQPAYDVTISTYHAFGSDLIRRFPDYFADDSDLQPVDDLGIDVIFREIIAGLPYDNPLKYADNYLGDLKSIISDAKRALLLPEDLLAVARQNESFIAQVKPLVQDTLAGLVRIDKSALARFEKLLISLAPISKNSRTKTKIDHVVPLADYFISDLVGAVEEAHATNKTTALTKWKNKWLIKNSEGDFVPEGAFANKKIRALSLIYDQYLQALKQRKLFDYDDMILRAVNTLSENTELRYTLQERYQYILLDEFQDTNGAQLRLVELLTDNPVNEGRPNVLAVGDDDQAIYAFQGADYSHMLRFTELYRQPLIVPLTENYRSTPSILGLADNITAQIEERLVNCFEGVDKTLIAANQNLDKKLHIVERREAKTEVSELAWVAKQIKKLSDGGLALSQIAVLAPQHKYLEPLIPFLHQQKISVRYEKRENVLDDPVIMQLVRMSELCLALSDGKHDEASSLWPEILSFDFWGLPTSQVWRLSWQASDEKIDWTASLLDNPELKPIALFFIRLSLLADNETLETMLDYLIGSAPLDLQEPDFSHYTSPFYKYYFDETVLENRFGSFWELLTNLTILRTRLRDYNRAEKDILHLEDFCNFIHAHKAAGIKILNTSPYQEAADAVQIMTAYKAKGQEYEAVFVLGVNDEIWGSKSRAQSSRLSLPPNLQFIRYAGATNDERLRLFYVAVTRAKTQLFLTNHTSNYAGKTLTRLKYLNESVNESGGVVSPYLPEGEQLVLPAEEAAITPITELATYWQQRHESAITRNEAIHLLSQRLERYRLSPTHVNAFTDLVNAGPQAFFLSTILRFPRAPNINGMFGSVMHQTLEWVHHFAARNHTVPSLEQSTITFRRQLDTCRLSKNDQKLLERRGQRSLSAYLTQRHDAILADSRSEFDFRNEGVFIGNAHMSGKIDKLLIDKKTKTIQIIDYKTGKSYSRWQHEIKLHNYEQQLYLYKTLVEKSRSFAGYKVISAYLEFIEPDEDGRINNLELKFDPARQERVARLAEVIWNRIKTLDLPDVNQYSADWQGIHAFEEDLLQEARSENRK